MLLVANVGPVNLLAGFLTTAARLLSTGLVAVFALGAVLAVSADRLPPGTRRRPLFARWADITPAWVVLASFLLALLTWPLLYLPLLLPAFVAAFQLRPERLHEWVVPRLLLIVALLAGYGWLPLPTLRDASGQRELLALALLVVPPVLALFVAGPLPGMVIRPLASITEVAVLVTLVWAALPVISTPVLPLTVTTVGVENGPTEDVRGHVVTTDDVNMVILQETGRRAVRPGRPGSRPGALPHRGGVAPAPTAHSRLPRRGFPAGRHGSPSPPGQPHRRSLPSPSLKGRRRSPS